MRHHQNEGFTSDRHSDRRLCDNLAIDGDVLFWDEAKRRLTEAGIILDASYPVRHAERLPEIVQEEIAKGRKFIIVGGGDGTISSVIDHFAYVNVVFGLLPLGTANSFARTLGIPLDLPGAIDVLVGGRVFDVDLGKINDHYFANGSSIGMPAIVGRATPHALKKWLGRGAYLLVGASKFMHYAPFRCIITINGQETSFNALDVRIANGGYQGGVLVAPDANPNDGKIVVHILTESSKWALGKEWARAALRAPFRAADLKVLKATELMIDVRIGPRTAPRPRVHDEHCAAAFLDLLRQCGLFRTTVKGLMVG